MDLARAPRRARLTARKKGSGYENGQGDANKSTTKISRIAKFGCEML